MCLHSNIILSLLRTQAGWGRVASVCVCVGGCACTLKATDNYVVYFCVYLGNFEN